MKKPLLVTAFYLFCLQTHAQKAALVAGVNFDKPISEIYGFNKTNLRYGIGYQIGLKTLYSITDKIELSPQLHFVNTRQNPRG